MLPLNISTFGSYSLQPQFTRKLVYRRRQRDRQKHTQNNKTGGSDGLVGELLEYGGSGMVSLLEQLFSVVWHEEAVPRQWRGDLIVKPI